ncbi:hypothetical protein EU528_04895 [Candidatus Thorarchaeota archaeon]|nr:MAG: hypothetical protein EU528_04895 [Candidatus Thorarchaeota archaeon]
MRRPVAMIILAVIILTTNIPSHVPANPLSVSSTNSGNFFCLSSNISMPQASVNISLICREVIPTESSGPIFIYEVKMNSSFQVRSNYTENTTIAFAYPADWRNFGNIIQLSDIEFDVFVDDIEVPTQILNISEISIDFDEIFDEDLESWDFLYENEFVLFNISLEAYEYSIVEVNTNFDVSSGTDVFEFEYCVGTARTWNGNTIEEVQISLDNTSMYMGNWFNPEDSLTAIQGVNRTTGYWSLDFSSFTEEYVKVSIWQKQWPYSNTIPSGSTTSNQTNTSSDQFQLSQAILFSAGIGLAIIVVVVIILTKLK